MKTVRLNNGIEMPMEGFGVFQIPEDRCEQAVKDAIDLGYRLIDTASSYQNEEAVGRAVAGCDVPREELFITTKAYIQQMGYEKTKQAFQESLDFLESAGGIVQRRKSAGHRRVQFSAGPAAGSVL